MLPTEQILEKITCYYIILHSVSPCQLLIQSLCGGGNLSQRQITEDLKTYSSWRTAGSICQIWIGTSNRLLVFITIKATSFFKVMHLYKCWSSILIQGHDLLSLGNHLYFINVCPVKPGSGQILIYDIYLKYVRFFRRITALKCWKILLNWVHLQLRNWIFFSGLSEKQNLFFLLRFNSSESIKSKKSHFTMCLFWSDLK